jgi:hypothetical protein
LRFGCLPDPDQRTQSQLVLGLKLGQFEQRPDASVAMSGHEGTRLLGDGIAWHEDLLRSEGSELVPGCCSPKEGNEMEATEGSISRMVLRSVGPSIRRALSSIVSVFSLPLLLLPNFFRSSV